MAFGAVAFALKVGNLMILIPTDSCVFTYLQAVLDGIARDEKTDNMVGIMGHLHALSPIRIQLKKSPSTRIL